MKYPLYVIRDKINGFRPTILVDSNQQNAYRGFGYQINEDKYMNYSPTDYDLFEIGYFDTDSGEIESKLPEFIVNGASVLNEK